jgi:hypothetical protein
MTRSEKETITANSLTVKLVVAHKTTNYIVQTTERHALAYKSKELLKQILEWKVVEYSSL